MIQAQNDILDEQYMNPAIRDAALEKEQVPSEGGDEEEDIDGTLVLFPPYLTGYLMSAWYCWKNICRV